MDSLFEDALRDLLSRLMQEARADSFGPAQRRMLAETLVESGFTELLLPESAGGSGLALAEAMQLCKLEGYYDLPVPFALTVALRGYAHAHGLALPEGMISYAAIDSASPDGAEEIILPRAPHGDSTGHMLIGARQACWLAPADARRVLHAYHGGLYAALAWPARALRPLTQDPQAATALAEATTLAMLAVCVGAMERAFELTLAYAGERKQFGRPLGKFQAIQQQISEMAQHVSAAGMALQIACDSRETAVAPLQPAAHRIAIAQYQVVLVADRIADIAHAVHGAIGISEAYPLHGYTRRIREHRLWSGSQQQWAASVGRHILDSPHDTLLAALTSDRA